MQIIEFLSSIIENEVTINGLNISVDVLYEKRHQILSILKYVLSQQILNESDLKIIGEAIDIMLYLTSFIRGMSKFSSLKMEVYTYLKDYRHIEVVKEYLDFLNS